MLRHTFPLFMSVSLQVVDSDSVNQQIWNLQGMLVNVSEYPLQRSYWEQVGAPMNISATSIDTVTSSATHDFVRGFCAVPRVAECTTVDAGNPWKMHHTHPPFRVFFLERPQTPVES